jgi:predicted small metal-binding protein
VVIGSGAEVKMGDGDSVELVVRCDCGFEARGEESRLVPEVQQHGRDAHNMDVTREQVLAMARPA